MQAGDTVDLGTLPNVTVVGTRHKEVDKKEDGWFDSWGSFGTNLLKVTPFVGSLIEIGEGIYNGDTRQILMGVVFLAVDVATMGEGGVLLRVGEEALEGVVKVAAKEEVIEIAEKELLETVEKEFLEETGEKTFQTYTKKNATTGEVYSGRTSGTGTPIENVAKRDKSHHMNEKGFGPAKIDKSSKSSNAIRGREQQLIKNNGGAKSSGGTSGNAINSISPKNKKVDVYMNAAKKAGWN